MLLHNIEDIRKIKIKNRGVLVWRYSQRTRARLAVSGSSSQGVSKVTQPTPVTERTFGVITAVLNKRFGGEVKKKRRDNQGIHNSIHSVITID